ncbi:hypothetical protein J2755_002126 [Methanohalophilus levihalophilus]|nr:hypothetical protein [Methanohalophilus levihalophilus]
MAVIRDLLTDFPGNPPGCTLHIESVKGSLNAG